MKLMARKRPFALGIIGFGSIGTVHLAAITNSGQTNFEVKAISDINNIPPTSKVTFYRDYKEMLADSSIQVVSVCTPPGTHYQCVTDALMAGKHVLVEKPPALTVLQCKNMVSLAIQKNKILFMAFHARYNPVVEVAKRELKGKEVNKIDIRYAEYVQNYHSPEGWIFNPKVAGGGVLMDSGINALSIVTDILPEATVFSVESANLFKAAGFKVETQGTVEFSFGDNKKGMINMDWMYQGAEIRQVIFSTDKNIYAVDIVKNSLEKDGQEIMNNDESREKVDQESEYRRVYHDFAQHLTKGVSLTSTKELKFILDVYRKASS